MYDDDFRGGAGAYVPGVSFSGLLTIVFIALKISKVIDWSWWWVLAPIWLPTAIFVAGILIALAVS